MLLEESVGWARAPDRTRPTAGAAPAKLEAGTTPTPCAHIEHARVPVSVRDSRRKVASSITDTDADSPRRNIQHDLCFPPQPGQLRRFSSHRSAHWSSPSRQRTDLFIDRCPLPKRHISSQCTGDERVERPLLAAVDLALEEHQQLVGRHEPGQVERVRFGRAEDKELMASRVSRSKGRECE